MFETHNSKALNGLRIINESINVTGNQITTCTHNLGWKLASNTNTPIATIILITSIVNQAAPSPIL